MVFGIWRGRRQLLRMLGVMACGAAVMPWRAVAAGPALDLGLAAQQALDAGEAGRAAELLTRAVRLNPDDAWLWGLLGRAEWARERRAPAARAFRRALGLRPDDAYSRMMLDMLGQQPLAAPPPAPPHGETPLERRAREEREAYAAQHGGDAPPGAGYRIRRVVLDPGHGGFDPGAVGPKGLREKDVNMAVARHAAQELRRVAPHLSVALTRSADTYLPLSARTAAANRFGADLFLSLHSNASTRAAAHGIETYSCSETASSREARRLADYENAVVRFDGPVPRREQFLDLEGIVFRFERRRYWRVGAQVAQRMQARLAEGLPFADRGAQHADFYVLRKARMPSVLLETGFLSNPDEERLLADAAMQRRIGVAVAEAVVALSAQEVAG
ncbi:hypothetical protein JCM16814_31170 [Desulfobaculum senezii]